MCANAQPWVACTRCDAMSPFAGGRGGKGALPDPFQWHLVLLYVCHYTRCFSPSEKTLNFYRPCSHTWCEFAPSVGAGAYVSKEEQALSDDMWHMPGITTTLGALVHAYRQHRNEDHEGGATPAERAGFTIAAVESERLFTGGSVHAALAMRDHLNSLTDAEWWAHEFLLHPNVWAPVHHLLQ